MLPPRTWDEFDDIGEFFNRPSENLYGATEWRVKGLTYPWFIQRLGSLGGNYFDKNMKTHYVFETNRWISILDTKYQTK